MSYKSIDTIQKLLSEDIFHYTKDKKKAAGRALGTFVEIITYYLLKQWGLDINTAIERPLKEYGNADITHNVEFTLHQSESIGKIPMDKFSRFSTKTILTNFGISVVSPKKGNLLDRNEILKNAFTLGNEEGFFYNAYLHNGTVEVYRMNTQPTAMIECKRVGVEEGMSKGPQTIEKAKQGSYVARTVSSLQRFRGADGRIMGILPALEYKKAEISDYYDILEAITSGETLPPKDFILTIGVVSNHGNWFTATNMNKELRVLANSFDWLLFLTDEGLVQFVQDLLLSPEPKYSAIREIFIQTYSPNSKFKAFTKAKMHKEADCQLNNYFQANLNRIENDWFEVLTPDHKSIQDLKKALHILLQR